MSDERYCNLDETLEVVLRTDFLGHVALEVWDLPTSTYLYAIDHDPPTDAERRRALAQRMMYEQRPDTPREVADDRALDCIAAFLRRPEMSGADFLQEVEALVNRTGRDTTTPGDIDL